MRMFAALLAVLLPAAAPAQVPFASFEAASDPVLNDPHDLTIGPDGRLYVADKFAGVIAVLDPDTLDVVDSFGGGELYGVHDISFGPDGRAYIAVTGTGSVAIYRFEDGKPVPDGSLGTFPRTEGALAHSNGRLYVMASGSGDLVAVENGDIVAGVRGLPGAHDVEEGPDGSVWVADTFGRRLVRFSPDLALIETLDDPAYGFVGPRYLAFDELGRLAVADQDAHRVVLIDPSTGALEGVIGDGTPGLGPNKLDDPEGVAVSGNSFFFSDSDNNRVVKYVVVMN